MAKKSKRGVALALGAGALSLAGGASAAWPTVSERPMIAAEARIANVLVMLNSIVTPSFPRWRRIVRRSIGLVWRVLSGHGIDSGGVAGQTVENQRECGRPDKCHQMACPPARRA